MDERKVYLSELVTLSVAAEEAGISKRTLQNHMKAGTAPQWVRKGREVLFLAGEIHAWRKTHYPDGQPRKGRRHEAL